MSIHRDFSRALVEFSKSVKTLENCFEDISKNMEEIKNMGDKSVKLDLEKELYSAELKNIKISELDKKVTEVGNIMLSKAYYENLSEEFKHYEKNFEEKVNTEVKKIQEKFQSQLNNQLACQKALAEKEIGILSAKLELAEEKLKYVCRLNNFVPFNEPKVSNKKVSFANPIAQQP